MKEFWDDLVRRKKNGELTSDEEILFKRFAKSIQFISADPHPDISPRNFWLSKAKLKW